MPSAFAQTLASPYLLYTTSILSFLFASFIKSRVQRKGPVSFAPALIKYNSLFYAVVSLYLFIGILISTWTEISQTSNPSLRTIICSHSTFTTDHALRYLYHFSKFYEYVDIFNVLAVGGVVNIHFSVHHFTTPYLTYARVLKHPAGWKVFAGLNTLHHTFMYAYFGGLAVFSDVLPITGCLQLFVGILGEMYIISKNFQSKNEDCGGQSALWANVLAVVLLSTYAILFSGDLKERGKKSEGKTE